MKLTKETLKRIIKEEIQAVLNEGKTTLDRTDKNAVRAAAIMIMKAEGVWGDKDLVGLDRTLRGALADGRKDVHILGDRPRTIDLMKHVTYIN